MVYTAVRDLIALVIACLIYAPTLLWHKFGVLMMGLHLNRMLAGSGLRVPWHRLVFHDWVKFLPLSEYVPYARRWYKTNLKANILGRLVQRLGLPRLFPVSCPPEVWAAAVKHHVERMDHHNEYYEGPDLGLWRRNGVPPDVAVVEMVADKMGAQWGYDGKWPTADNWPRLAQGFDEKGFPTPRSKALFFCVCCAAGFEPCFQTAGVEYGWVDAQAVLGAQLTSRLQACGYRHGVGGEEG